MRRALSISALLLALALPATAGASFEPGIVKVDGYDWSTSSSAVPVSLDQDGKTTYTVGDILETADGQTSQFSLANVPGVEIMRPGTPVRSVRCTGNQVRAGNDACPRFVATADKTTMILRSGVRIDYADAAPTIFITKADDLTVTLSPASKKIKSGTSVKFTAKVSGGSGSLSFAWDFGDGKTAKTSGANSSSTSHAFTGDDQTFNVVVTVTSPANPRSYTGLSVITVGKVKKAKKKQKPKDKPKNETDTNQDDSSTYDPGYVPGDYDDGSGPGTGSPSTGSPSPSSPEPDEKKQDQPVADDSGQTVTGQLIDPTTTATVIPTTDTPATGEPEAGAAEPESKGGGGIPDGAKAALGIGALLGLGGLTEAGAFTGAFRRLRLRP